jgi:dethiobiotin synthetase
MRARILFVTGSDTGVGKSVFAAILTRALRAEGVRVAGVKPLCSGDRADARLLHAAAGKVLSLGAVNPWHFRAPLAPVLAARQERRCVRRRSVVTHLQRLARRFEVLVVEGAGGLLSPLGEDFDSRDLIVALKATPIAVCPNRLGAVNQVRLLLAALPRTRARQALVVLVDPAKPDRASRTNLKLLAEFVNPQQILALPWLGR